MKRSRVFLSLLYAASIGTSACEKKTTSVAGAGAPAPSGLPPLEASGAAANAAHQNLAHDPTGANDPGENAPPGGALPAGHPEVAPGANPHAGGFAGTTPGDDLDPQSSIKGTLALSPKLKDKAAVGDVIFLVARGQTEGGPGPVLAVKRLTVAKWPIAFELDSRDAMVAGTKLSGNVVVTARVDKDGDAISKNPGDLVGTSKPVRPPADKVVITFDNVL